MFSYNIFNDKISVNNKKAKETMKKKKTKIKDTDFFYRSDVYKTQVFNRSTV